MKKGWKIFWIVCAVLAAVGLLLTAAGVMLGGMTALRSTQDLEVGITPRWLERLENREQDEEAPEPGMKDGVIHDHVDEISLELGGITARLLHLEGRKGRLLSGHDADIVLFDEDVRVHGVYYAGRRVS